MSFDSLFHYHQKTGQVTVLVSVNFLPEQSKPEEKRWFWGYHIRIKNDGDSPVQLISRRWEIRDDNGSVHIVKGEGVVGEQPIIDPGEKFDYVSGCPLTTSSGSMSGSYYMVDDHGREFEVEIPHFLLKDPVAVL